MRSTIYIGAFLVLFAAATGAAEHRKLVEAPAPAAASDCHHHHKAWAQAPGPAGAEEEHDWQTDADVLFIVSADQAEFTTASTLQLTGVTTTVQYHDTFKRGAMAGIVRTPAFVNASAGSQYVAASGAWLAGPDAALVGDANNSDSAAAVLLALSSPAYDAATQSISFTVSVLPAEEAGLKLHKGVVNGLVWQAAKGNGAPLVTTVAPGATLTNVALFIDSNKASLHPAASTEDWRGGWGGGWGGGNGGWGGGWNNGWGRGWGGWGGGWNNGWNDRRGWGWGWGWGK